VKGQGHSVSSPGSRLQANVASESFTIGPVGTERAAVNDAHGLMLIVGPYCTHCRVNSDNKRIKYVVETAEKIGRVSKINNPK